MNAITSQIDTIDKQNKPELLSKFYQFLDISDPHFKTTTTWNRFLIPGRHMCDGGGGGSCHLTPAPPCPPPRTHLPTRPPTHIHTPHPPTHPLTPPSWLILTPLHRPTPFDHPQTSIEIPTMGFSYLDCLRNLKKNGLDRSVFLNCLEHVRHIPTKMENNSLGISLLFSGARFSFSWLLGTKSCWRQWRKKKATGPPIQSTGPPRTDAGMGIGLLRGVSIWQKRPLISR